MSSWQIRGVPPSSSNARSSHDALRGDTSYAALVRRTAAERDISASAGEQKASGDLREDFNVTSRPGVAMTGARNGTSSAQEGSGTPASSAVSTPASSVVGSPSARGLAEWIATVLARNGGDASPANLSSLLKADNPDLYRAMTDVFGGLTVVFDKFKDMFVVESRAPSLHVSLAGLSGDKSAFGYLATDKTDATSSTVATSVTHATSAPPPSSSRPPVVLARQSGPTRPRTDSGGSLTTELVAGLFSGEPDACSVTLRASLDILSASKTSPLKIVDLANVLRQRLPKATLNAVRDKHGGLMAVLTRFPDVFVVHRERTAEAVALTAKFRESACIPSPATSVHGRETCESYGSIRSGDVTMSASPPESPEVGELSNGFGGSALPVLGSAVELPSRPAHHDTTQDNPYNASPVGLASVSTSATPVSATSSVGGVHYPPAHTAFVPLPSDDRDGISYRNAPAHWNNGSQGPSSRLEAIHLPTVNASHYGRPPTGISPPSSGSDHAPFQNVHGLWNGMSLPAESVSASPHGPAGSFDPSGNLHYHHHATPVSDPSPLLSSVSPGTMSSVDAAAKAGLADASRCLHIGNVPLTMTEAELLDVLKTHGRVETIKLVTQKGRRFAFCNFVTIDDAINAKISLSRSDMWRYNVSFAKRETLPLPPQATAPVMAGMGPGSVSGGRPSGPAPHPAVVESLVRSGYSLEEAAYLASCMASGDTTKPAKQRNLFPSRHLWIGGLVNATRADILDVFGSFGPIEHFKFIKGRRCAFVDFYRQQDAEVAFNRMQGSCVGTSYIDLGFETVGMEDLGLDDSHIPPGLQKPHRVSKYDPLYQLLTNPPKTMGPRPPVYHAGGVGMARGPMYPSGHPGRPMVSPPMAPHGVEHHRMMSMSGMHDMHGLAPQYDPRVGISRTISEPAPLHTAGGGYRAPAASHGPSMSHGSAGMDGSYPHHVSGPAPSQSQPSLLFPHESLDLDLTNLGALLHLESTPPSVDASFQPLGSAALSSREQ